MNTSHIVFTSFFRKHTFFSRQEYRRTFLMRPSKIWYQQIEISGDVAIYISIIVIVFLVLTFLFIFYFRQYNQCKYRYYVTLLKPKLSVTEKSEHVEFFEILLEKNHLFTSLICPRNIMLKIISNTPSRLHTSSLSLRYQASIDGYCLLTLYK